MTVISMVTSPVPPVLDRARALVTPVQREAVSRLSPSIRLAAEYHLGWCEVDGRPVVGDGGKCVRPALALLSAEAVGADPSLSLPGAAAVELVHNFSLVHADVVDGDSERRSRPAVWAVFGIGSAIIVGDAMHTLAHQLLLEVPGPPGVAAGRSLAEATSQMIAGQADDMAFETAAGISVEACLGMEAAKTGAILACASSIGAILAGASDAAVAALHEFGMHLGQSYQAISRTVELLEVCGGRAVAMAEARRHRDAALACLSAAALVPEAVAELTDLANFVTDREV